MDRGSTLEISWKIFSRKDDFRIYSSIIILEKNRVYTYMNGSSYKTFFEKKRRKKDARAFLPRPTYLFLKKINVVKRLIDIIKEFLKGF